ncbi:hypothetical protein SO802_008738, partial [Lithocarpus litseifolius]
MSCSSLVGNHKLSQKSVILSLSLPPKVVVLAAFGCEVPVILRQQHICSFLISGVQIQSHKNEYERILDRSWNLMASLTTSGCYTQNNTQVLELLVFPMVGNLALSLSAKAVALGFEFGHGVLCEHEAANMSIGGKELNLMVSLTTSEQIKATTNLAQNLDPVQNFLALKLCNKSWTQ